MIFVELELYVHRQAFGRFYALMKCLTFAIFSMLIPITASHAEGSGEELLEASMSGNVEKVVTLLDQGVAINYRRNDGATPLMLAADKGHVNVVDVLLKKGASTDVREKKAGYTPLLIASFRGNDRVVRSLLVKGAQPDDTIQGGYSALMLAAGNGHMQVVATLLEAGATINHQADNGYSALYQASKKGHAEIVRYLLRNEAMVDLQDEDSATALIVSAQAGYPQVVGELLYFAAEVDKPALHGATALIMASQEGYEDVVKLVIANGADVNAQRMDVGFTALNIASQNGHIGIVKALLMAGAEIDHRASNGTTPLFIASYKGHEDVVDILLENGADPTIPEMGGSTAIENAKTRQIKRMLKGAAKRHSASSKDPYGISARDPSAVFVRQEAQEGIWVLDGIHNSVEVFRSASTVSATREAGLHSNWHRKVRVNVVPIASKIESSTAVLREGTYTFVSLGHSQTTTTEDDSIVTEEIEPQIILRSAELQRGATYRIYRRVGEDGGVFLGAIVKSGVCR